jgi:hypothetical protein
MPRVNAVYADNPVLTAAQKKRLAKERVSTNGKVRLRLSYAVLNVFQRYWWGQNDPLYAVLSRRGTSVQFVDVTASTDEVERLQDVAEEIIASKDSTAAERRVAEGLLKQLPQSNPAKRRAKGKCGCGMTDAGATICGCVVPNPARRINQRDYKFYVVVGDKIESGWEYREDAKDQIAENLPPVGAKVLALKTLISRKIDPNNNSNWQDPRTALRSNPISRGYWTTASKSYDYGYTVNTGQTAKSITGATWRLVTTTDDARFQSHQIPRYQSGLSGIVPANSADSRKLKLPDVKTNPCKCGVGRTKQVGPARRMTRAQIESLVWQKTPRDYRGMWKGKKAILVLTKQGTSLVHLDRIRIEQLRQLAGLQDNPTCKYGTSKLAIRSISVEAPWMRRTVRGGRKVWDNADSAARAVCKSKPSTAAASSKMTVTYRYVNGEEVKWQLLAKCSREKLSTRVKKTLIPAAGFDFPSKGRKPTGQARQAFLDLLAYYDTGAPIQAPWDE